MKFSNEEIMAIRQRCAEGYTAAQVAVEFGSSENYVKDVRSGWARGDLPLVTRHCVSRGCSKHAPGGPGGGRGCEFPVNCLCPGEPTRGGWGGEMCTRCFRWLPWPETLGRVRENRGRRSARQSA